MTPDNPPAFPLAAAAAHCGQYGMSLRDYFAAQTLAMPAPSSWTGHLSGGLRTTPEAIAERAYLIADAMLAARTQDAAS